MIYDELFQIQSMMIQSMLMKKINSLQHQTQSLQQNFWMIYSKRRRRLRVFIGYL